MKSFSESHKATLVALALSFVVVGCALFQPHVTSPVDGSRVNKDELHAQAVAMVAKFKAADASIAQQEAFRDGVLKLVTSYVPVLPTPWGGVVTGLLGLGTAAATFDNVRTRSKAKPRAVSGHTTFGGSIATITK